jgi:DNA polymerase III subunit beta
MERISILAEQSQDPEKTVEVDIDVAHKEMRLKVDTPTAGSGREAVGIERIKGDDISIAFNAKFLLDGLKAIASEQVQLRINSNSTPVVLESVGNLRFRYLIMPILVSQPQN